MYFNAILIVYKYFLLNCVIIRWINVFWINLIVLAFHASNSYVTIIINFIFMQLNPSAFQMANNTPAMTNKKIMTMMRINHQVSLQVPTVRASASQYDTALQVSDKVVHVSPWSASLLFLDAGDPKNIRKRSRVFTQIWNGKFLFCINQNLFYFNWIDLPNVDGKLNRDIATKKLIVIGNASFSAMFFYPE